MDSDIISDAALRRRICDNYYDRNGRQYTKEELFNKLPRCDKPSVFTHCELRPKNIMVSGSRVTAIVDWETAGWYPEYWEHTGLWAQRGDWKKFMKASAPQVWDFEAFSSVSEVLI